MAGKLRVVLDTNVIVSQLLLPMSVPSQAVRVALRRGIVLSAPPHLRELFDVVSRPKFDAYVARDLRLEELRRFAELVVPVAIGHPTPRSRDPKDDMLLEIAKVGDATHLVTGDEDLLALDPFEKVRVVTPSAFLQLVKGW